MTVRAVYSATNEGILSPQSTDEELTECDLGSQCSSQWSPTEGDAQSQWSSTEEELEPQCSATKEEQSATEEGPDVVIPQERSLLTNIWNVLALRQTLMRMMTWFKRPATCVIDHSPVASNSSSPLLYEYAYRADSTDDENDDQHLQFGSFDTPDYEDVDLIDSSFGTLDYEDVYLIDFESLAKVGNMIRRHQIIEPGNPQILHKFFADNSAVLDSFLYNLFTSAGLFIDKWTCMDVSKFTSQVADHCVMILKIANKLLCLMWKKLAEAECESFAQDLRYHYQMLCARQLVENITKAADSISNLKWPASHIYQMLVLYKAIDDILIGEGSLTTGRVFSICPSDESDRIVRQMRVNFKGIFDGIKCTICENLNGPQYTVSQVGHPVTKFLIGSMELFANHSRTVQDTCIGNDSSSLGHHLSEVISYWVEQLRTHFISYTEGRNYIFLLNNLTHFDEETTESLKELMPNSYPNNELGYILKELIDMNTWNYLVNCWGPVRDCVELSSGEQPRWSSLDTFTSQFNIVYMHQKNWVLQTQLKHKLRPKIKEFLVPHYDTFLKKLRKRSLGIKFFFQKAKYMSTEELKRTLDGIFESEHKK